MFPPEYIGGLEFKEGDPPEADQPQEYIEYFEDSAKG